MIEVTSGSGKTTFSSTLYYIKMKQVPPSDTVCRYSWVYITNFFIGLVQHNLRPFHSGMSKVWSTSNFEINSLPFFRFCLIKANRCLIRLINHAILFQIHESRYQICCIICIHRLLTAILWSYALIFNFNIPISWSSYTIGPTAFKRDPLWNQMCCLAYIFNNFIQLLQFWNCCVCICF